MTTAAGRFTQWLAHTKEEQMNALGFPDDLVPGFEMRVAQAGNDVTAVCTGSLDAPDAVACVQPELLRLHNALVEKKVKSVRLEMPSVEYMNSSGIKCFMAWFLKAEQSKDQSYTIEVVYDPERTWQYVSFSTMGRIAPRVLKMSPIAKVKK
jgi:hypothetical protein